MFEGVVSPLANISTAVTDLGLALEALLFTYLLSRSSQRSVQWWAIAFLAVAIAALSGSIYHGFYRQLSPPIIALCQDLTHVAISISSGAMVMGCLTSLWAGPLLMAGIGAIGLKFALFCHLSLSRKEAFIYPVVDYLSAMLLVGLMMGWAYLMHRVSYAGWMIGGIGVSAIAAVVLAIKWTFHPWLSPDAIYHLVQMVALYCFFMGSRDMGDRHQQSCIMGDRN